MLSTLAQGFLLLRPPETGSKDKSKCSHGVHIKSGSKENHIKI